MNSCTTCGADTKNPKFCCKSCAAKYNNKIPKRKAKIYFCKDCGSPTGKRRTKCDDCLKPKDMTLQEAMYLHLHKTSAFALVRSRARSVVKSRKKVCEYCGYDKHVEICHRQALSTFPLDTPVSVVNSPENLILLCPNCHWEFDHPSS